jgi:hypothetical protein
MRADLQARHQRLTEAENEITQQYETVLELRSNGRLSDALDAEEKLSDMCRALETFKSRGRVTVKDPEL